MTLLQPTKDFLRYLQQHPAVRAQIRAAPTLAASVTTAIQAKQAQAEMTLSKSTMILVSNRDEEMPAPRPGHRFRR